MGDGSFYKLDAVVGEYAPSFSNKEPQRHYALNIVDFGIRKGDNEISQTKEVPDGGLTKLFNILKTMKRPTPITFLRVIDERKNFMSMFKGKKLQFEVTFGRYGSDGKVAVNTVLTLDDAHILKIQTEKVKVSDVEIIYERVDAYFKAAPVVEVK